MNDRPGSTSDTEGPSPPSAALPSAQEPSRGWTSHDAAYPSHRPRPSWPRGKPGPAAQEWAPAWAAAWAGTARELGRQAL